MVPADIWDNPFTLDVPQPLAAINTADTDRNCALDRRNRCTAAAAG